MTWDSPKGNLKEATSSDVRFLLAETDRQEQGKDVRRGKAKTWHVSQSFREVQGLVLRSPGASAHEPDGTL